MGWAFQYRTQPYFGLLTVRIMHGALLSVLMQVHLFQATAFCWDNWTTAQWVSMRTRMRACRMGWCLVGSTDCCLPQQTTITTCLTLVTSVIANGSHSETKPQRVAPLAALLMVQ